MKKISGYALVIIGLLHSLIGLVLPGAIGFSGIWQEIIDVGVIDTGFWLVLIVAINAIVVSQQGDRSRQSDSV
jgi:hypothetical protein